MDTSRPGLCDVGYHIGRLREEGRALAEAAGEAGLAAPVPACPGWRVRDLLKHVGYVHRWAAGYVERRDTGRIHRATEEELLAQGPGDGVLLDWFREGHAGLVGVLERADPGLECWTFLDAPSPLAFWARRQAHETAVHRADAEQAAAAAWTASRDPGHRGEAVTGTGSGTGEGAGGDRPTGRSRFPARFAVDGIDELIMGFVGRDARRGSWQGPPGTLGIHATDGAAGGAHWCVAGGDGHLRVTAAPGPADCDVTGPATDLYLALWNRAGLGGLTVDGAPAVLAAFRDEFKVTWG